MNLQQRYQRLGRDDSWMGALRDTILLVFGLPLALAALGMLFASKDLTPEQQAAQAERAQHRAAGEFPCGPAGTHKWCKPQALQRPPQRSQQRTDVDADYPADDGDRSNQPTAPTSTKRRTVW